MIAATFRCKEKNGFIKIKSIYKKGLNLWNRNDILYLVKRLT